MHELLEQQEKLQHLITDSKKLEQGTLSIMLQARKEIVSLNQLSKQYPGSENIKNRLIQLDKFLETSTNTLNEIKGLLADFLKQNQEINKLIEKYHQMGNESNNKVP